ncbi:MAG TPA: response regulator transcription factor [Miltoncostaeaceae bacterium]|jgi:two-component system response regulator MprA|nr:response regulator transcription factor [Miltoncostaeaceae bacterium]
MEGRLLVVDEDPRVRAELSRALEYEGFDVAAASDASGALAEFRAAPPDLMVMEARLPDDDGLEVCRRLRGDGARVPILIVTAADAVADRIAGLEAGADDYLVKPFSTAELIARVRALLRRRRDLSSLTSNRYADLMLDHSTREVRRGTRPITLTRREFDLLALFMANPEVAMPRTRLVGEAWGGEPDLPGTASVDVYVGYLRRKLEERGEPRLLHTVRGVGYQLRLPPEAGSGAP